MSTKNKAPSVRHCNTDSLVKKDSHSQQCRQRPSDQSFFRALPFEEGYCGHGIARRQSPNDMLEDADEEEVGDEEKEQEEQRVFLPGWGHGEEVCEMGY